MLADIFTYKLLETVVTLIFVIVSLTALVLTVYFFILQRIAKKKKNSQSTSLNPNVGQYFVRSIETRSADDTKAGEELNRVE